MNAWTSEVMRRRPSWNGLAFRSFLSGKFAPSALTGSVGQCRKISTRHSSERWKYSYHCDTEVRILRASYRQNLFSTDWYKIHLNLHFNRDLRRRLRRHQLQNGQLGRYKYMLIVRGMYSNSLSVGILISTDVWRYIHTRSIHIKGFSKDLKWSWSNNRILFSCFFWDLWQKNGDLPKNPQVHLIWGNCGVRLGILQRLDASIGGKWAKPFEGAAGGNYWAG